MTARTLPLSAVARKVASYHLMARKLDLGPHACRILAELDVAMTAGMTVSQIILSATLVDVMAHETSDMFAVDISDDEQAAQMGLSWLTAEERRELDWLRFRRNGIVHYEGPVSGMTAGAGDEAELNADAERALAALLPLLDSLERV